MKVNVYKNENYESGIKNNEVVVGQESVASNKETSKVKQPKQFGYNWRKWLYIGLAIIFILLVAYLAIPERFNILFVGSDQRDEVAGKRSDSLMVLSIPKSPAKNISLVTIPRDSKVLIDGFEAEEEKITHAYGYGKEAQEGILGNIDLTKKEVEQLLGINIFGTVEFTFESFENLIDYMGGVDTQTYGHIDGKRALERSRNRFRDGGDFARTADQREIFMSLFSRMKNPKELWKAYGYMKAHEQTRFKINKTSLAAFSLATFIRRGGIPKIGEIKTDVVPGEGATLYSQKFGISMYYWIVDKEGTKELIKKMLR